VDGLLTSVVAVAGTLAGSALTFLFARLTATRTERVAREERLRLERIAAYAAYAGAVTELRQALIALWFLQRTDPPDPGTSAAHTEADRRGAAADHARLKVRLLTDDGELLDLADAAFEPIGALTAARNRTELRKVEDLSQEALTAFVSAAGRQIR
jgi:hypothetical protein